MSSDAEKEVVRINVKLLGGLLGILGVLVAAIAWSVRLESRVDETAREVIRHDARIDEIARRSNEDHDRSTRMEAKLDYVGRGIEEIKETLKQDRK
jgi:hypothetical protein